MKKVYEKSKEDMVNSKIGLEIKTIVNLMKRHMSKAEAIEQQSLTATQRWFMRFLYNNRNKDIFQKDLESHFSIRRSTATGILKLMEKNGLINKQEVDYDARLKKITLTPKAISMMEQAEKEFNEMDKILLKGISESELIVLSDILEKIKNNLEQLDKN